VAGASWPALSRRMLTLHVRATTVKYSRVPHQLLRVVEPDNERRKISPSVKLGQARAYSVARRRSANAKSASIAVYARVEWRLHASAGPATVAAAFRISAGYSEPLCLS
jgi:hypothetical protein